MKFTLFKAGYGDCNLITGDDGTTMLVDGGLKGSFKEHVYPRLAAMAANDQMLDVVCVSHIDEDHINGILELIERAVAWEVHRFQIGQHEVPNSNPNPDHPQPDFDPPPRIGEIWHNGFDKVFEDNQGPIEGQLASAMRAPMGAFARLSAFSPDPALRKLGTSYAKLIAGEGNALLLRDQLKNELLGIPHNPTEDGKLLMIGDQPFELLAGDLAIRLLGPRADQLENLRDEWNTWLDDHPDFVSRLTSRFFGDLHLPPRALLTSSGELGDFSGVTTPNIASICFLVEEDDQKILMTGDGVWQDILTGLEHAEVIDEGAGLHVDVLKVPHHGAAANTHPDFARRITADHYVFCGNGDETNPEDEVIRAYVASRRSDDPAIRSSNPETGNPFKLWFNYHRDNNLSTARKEHFILITNTVTDAAASSDGQIEFEFVEGDAAEIDISAD